jgi:hypothetical protein
MQSRYAHATHLSERAQDIAEARKEGFTGQHVPSIRLACDEARGQVHFVVCRPRNHNLGIPGEDKSNFRLQGECPPGLDHIGTSRFDPKERELGVKKGDKGFDVQHVGCAVGARRHGVLETHVSRIPGLCDFLQTKYRLTSSHTEGNGLMRPQIVLAPVALTPKSVTLVSKRVARALMFSTWPEWLD